MKTAIGKLKLVLITSNLQTGYIVVYNERLYKVFSSKHDIENKDTPHIVIEDIKTGHVENANKELLSMNVAKYIFCIGKTTESVHHSDFTYISNSVVSKYTVRQLMSGVAVEGEFTKVFTRPKKNDVACITDYKFIQKYNLDSGTPVNGVIQDVVGHKIVLELSDYVVSVNRAQIKLVSKNDYKQLVKIKKVCLK